MNGEKHVVVVDDDEAVRESLQALLVTAGHKVTTYPSGETFLNAPDHNRCGCVLLDIRMPGLSGFDVQRRLAEEGNQTPVVVVTGNADVQLAVQALKEGAMDLIEKPYTDVLILEKVSNALAAAEEQSEERQQTQETRERISRLTPREYDVLKQLIDGHQNKVIAQKLGISHRTVEIYRAKVMQKMQAKNLADLVRATLAAGL
jgi:two-component system response regulator FixJ